MRDYNDHYNSWDDRFPNHQTLDRVGASSRPQPHFDEYVDRSRRELTSLPETLIPESPSKVESLHPEIFGVDLPRGSEVLRNIPGSLGRQFEGLMGLISPQVLLDPFGKGFTEEQRGVGSLVSGVAGSIWDLIRGDTSMIPESFFTRESDILVGKSKDSDSERDAFRKERLRSQFSHTAPLVAGFEDQEEHQRLRQSELTRRRPAIALTGESLGQLTPYHPEHGWQGTGALATMIEQDPADLLLEMGTGGIGLGFRALRAGGSVRRLLRAADPRMLDFAQALDDTNLMTGRTTAQQIARSSVSLKALDEAGNVLQMGTGTYVGPRQIATASHVPFRGLQGEVLTPHSIEYEVLGGAGQRGKIAGVLDLDPQRDIAILEALGPESIDYADISRGLDAGERQVGLSRAGVFGGETTGMGYEDLRTGARLGETTARGVETTSGAGLFTDAETISGAYLGELGDRGIFTPGADIQELLSKTRGRVAVDVADIDAATHVGSLNREGLSFRAARGDKSLRRFGLSGEDATQLGLGVTGLQTVGQLFDEVDADPKFLERHIDENTRLRCKRFYSRIDVWLGVGLLAKDSYLLSDYPLISGIKRTGVFDCIENVSAYFGTVE